MSDSRTDFHLLIQENGSFLLTAFGLLGGCLSATSIYFLKSRCSHIKLCCGLVDCVRQPLQLTAENVEEDVELGNYGGGGVDVVGAGAGAVAGV